MKKTLIDFDFEGKKVLLRCDLNVPMDSDGKVSDNKRIRASLPTINYLLEKGAAVIIMSHLGRPKGKADEKYSLAPVRDELEKLLGRKIIFSKSDLVVDDKVIRDAKALKSGEVMLLENTRYRKEEEECDNTFSKELASLADIYINDAFGTSHRAHASNVGVCKYLPSGLGYLLEKEVSIMKDKLDDPLHPFVAILGGSKVSDKIDLIENLLNKADTVIIGGAMAYTFLKAEGKNVAKSLVEEDKVDLAKSLIDKADKKGVNFLLPVDSVCSDDINSSMEPVICTSDNMKENLMGLDIGPETIKLYTSALKGAKEIVWNGPMGVFENRRFSNGTNSLAKALAESDAITIVGGGDSASAIEKSGYENKITHISTGGGASLELLEGKKLPGIEAIDDR